MSAESTFPVNKVSDPVGTSPAYMPLDMSAGGVASNAPMGEPADWPSGSEGYSDSCQSGPDFQESVAGVFPPEAGELPGSSASFNPEPGEPVPENQRDFEREEGRGFSGDHDAMDDEAGAETGRSADELYKVRTDTDPPGVPRPPEEPEMVALRSLLMQRELALLENIKERLEDPIGHAHYVSQVVAEAILLRSGKDDKLERAMDPIVEKLFKSALRKKPLDYANVLFPLMGPAIRRSIAEMFRSMLDNFHKSVEMAFSWKGLRWRFESLRTGKPFSEVVMLHTLVYRVEQLFLIHRETGLVLNHIVNEGVASQDADMVSAMLTAIQDFARDCFVSGQEGELESLQMGEYTILVEQSPYAYIACVLRGNPPIDVRRKLRSTLELIQVEFIEHLVGFNGNTSPFLLAERHLNECLVSRYVDEEKPLPLWVKALPILLLLALVSGFIYWRQNVRLAEETALAQQRQEEQKHLEFLYGMDRYVDTLRNEPGIIVLDVKEYSEVPWSVSLMRDELARDPAVVLRDAGAGPKDFELSSMPYISLEPVIVAKRVMQKIRPPESVAMNFSSTGTLTLTGTAPVDWMMRVRQEALALPGVKKIDMTGLTDPRMDYLKQLVRDVETVTVEFPLGKDTPVDSDLPKLKKAVETLTELERLASDMGIGVQLTVYGHADTLGNDKRNYEISQARARTLAAMLYAKGSSMPISLYGMGAEYADKTVVSPKGDQASRKVELRVHLSKMASATPEELRN